MLETSRETTRIIAGQGSRRDTGFEKLLDPNNFGRMWRTDRDDLVVPEVTTRSFRKAVATLIDDEGLSARIGADQLGHTRISMTQDRYMSRGRVHTQVAELLDRTINDE
jgi:integrase